MNEIESIGQERFRVFALSGIGVGILYFVATSRLLDAVLMGLCVGLLGSGVAVARRLTSAPAWETLEAQARAQGTTARKWKVWLANLAPFAVATGVSIGWLGTR